MHGDAEAATEACQGLRGQADFRHQHQRLPALRQAMDDRLQVDLGLAAAGHAIQQERLEAVGGSDRGHRLGLVRVERGTGQWLRVLGGHAQRNPLGQPALGQAARGGAPVLHAFAQHVLIHDGFGQQLGQLPWTAACAQLFTLGVAFGGQLPTPVVCVGQDLAMAQRAGQGGAQHLAQWRMGVARQPLQALPQLPLQQRLRVAPGQGLAQSLAVVGLAVPHHHTDQLPVAERHLQAAADRDRRCIALRRQVVEQAGQGDRQGDLQGRNR